MKPLTIDGAYTVDQDAILRFHDLGFNLIQSDPDTPTSLSNLGSVTVRDDSAGAGVTGMRTQGGTTFDRQFLFANSGDFHVLAPGHGGSAFGFELYAESNIVNNGGLYDVRSDGYALGGFANGYLNLYNFGSWSVQSTSGLAVGVTVETDGSIVNVSHFTVSGADEALGVNFNNSGRGDFMNTGSLYIAGGAGGAIGVQFHGGTYSFDNQGQIVVLDNTSTASVGVAFERDGHGVYDSIVNSGQIQADYAFLETTYFGKSESESIQNSGAVIGKIDLGGKADEVTNTGAISGGVLLGSGDDIFSDQGQGVIAGVVYGGSGADTLVGADGAETLVGDNAGHKDKGGDDVLVGGHGADSLWGGGGHDVFTYDSVKDSTATATDVIGDLGTGDTIDLSAIDANVNLSGDQAFTLVAELDHHAGEVALHYDTAARVTWLMADTDGDGKADLLVQLNGDHEGFSSFVL